MKKFFAVVLGLALVLGLASVASAEFTASGKLTMTWTYNLGTEANATDLAGDSEFFLTLSNAWDNASANLKLKYDADTVGSPTELVVDGYEFAYAFSDQFTLKAAKSFEVKTPIFETKANIPNATGEEVALSGEFTLDGGWVKVATNMIVDKLDLAVGAEYAFDPVTVGGVVDYDDDGTVDLGIYAKYAVTDQITLTGDVAVLDPDNQNVAIKAEYAGDPFTAAAQIRYDVDGDAGLYMYKVEGSYQATETLKLSANFSNDDSVVAPDDPENYEIKAAITINEGPVLSFIYNDDEVLTAKLEASF